MGLEVLDYNVNGNQWEQCKNFHEIYLRLLLAGLAIAVVLHNHFIQSLGFQIFATVCEFGDLLKQLAALLGGHGVNEAKENCC